MLRPKISEEMKIIRENGARYCLSNSKKYVSEVAYGDTQRFRYDDKGNILLDFGSEKETGNTVLVWGCISSAYPNDFLFRVSDKFNSTTYKDILQKHIVPLNKAEPSKPIGFVHDWFPVHRSKSVIEFANINKKSIVFLDWPKYFGDVMPVESIWFEMSKEFTNGNVKALNEDDLWRAISLIWRKVSTDVFVKKLIQEIPLKLQKVVQSGGLIYID